MWRNRRDATSDMCRPRERRAERMDAAAMIQTEADLNWPPSNWADLC